MGAWLDPEHKVRFEASGGDCAGQLEISETNVSCFFEGPPEAAPDLTGLLGAVTEKLFPPGEDEIHFTAGFGLVPWPGIQVDAAWDERELMAKADNGFLVTELVLLGLFLIGLATGTEIHIDSVGLFFGGPYTAVFWVFVVGLGIVIPLFVQLLAVNHTIRHTPIAPILVLVGGILLRFVIVYAGQFSRWSPV